MYHIMTHKECRDAGCICFWMERVDNDWTDEPDAPAKAYMEFNSVRSGCPVHPRKYED